MKFFEYLEYFESKYGRERYLALIEFIVDYWYQEDRELCKYYEQRIIFR